MGYICTACICHIVHVQDLTGLKDWIPKFLLRMMILMIYVLPSEHRGNKLNV